MRRIEARKSLLLKKLEEIEAVWMEKRERGRAPHGKRRLLHTPLDVASTSDLFAKPPVLTGIFTVMNLPGLPEEVSYPLSLPAGKKLTADEIGP